MTRAALTLATIPALYVLAWCYLTAREDALGFPEERALEEQP